MKLSNSWEHMVGGLGLGLFVCGSYLGLFVAPPEKYMGEVGRNLYIHVPTAWAALGTFAAAFFAAVAQLRTRRLWWDDVVVACVEVGVVLGILMIVQGALWARPTWGVYWTWDPRLTTSAIMVLAFVSVLVLREYVEDFQQRAAWSAIGAVLAFISVPIVFFSIKWWRTIHQPFSTGGAISNVMKMPLFINVAAMTCIGLWLIARRARLVRLLRTRIEPGEDQTPSTLVAGD